MTTAKNNNAVAIVVGCGLIAAAIFFGLRSRPADTVGAGAPAAPAPTVDRRNVEAEVARALEENRASFVERCWTPVVAKQPGPTESSYTFDIEIDAQGRQIARGIHSGPGAREDVANCLRLLIAPIKVTAPGRRVNVRVPMKLP